MRKKKSIPQMYTAATKGLQNYGRNLRNNVVKEQAAFRSRPNNKNYYGSVNPFPNPFAAKSYQKKQAKHKKKPAIGVNNKMKGSFGETEIRKGKRPIIKINVKKHKGDRAELADTIKHELMHAKHPKMSEKMVQKKTKVRSQAEQDSLIAKLRHKKLNYKAGAIKRKLKMSGTTQPGDFIKGMNDAKRTAIMGLV